MIGSGNGGRLAAVAGSTGTPGSRVTGFVYRPGLIWAQSGASCSLSAATADGVTSAPLPVRVNALP